VTLSGASASISPSISVRTGSLTGRGYSTRQRTALRKKSGTGLLAIRLWRWLMLPGAAYVLIIQKPAWREAKLPHHTRLLMACSPSRSHSFLSTLFAYSGCSATSSTLSSRISFQNRSGKPASSRAPFVRAPLAKRRTRPDNPLPATRAGRPAGPPRSNSRCQATVVPHGHLTPRSVKCSR
jgi:hypothetical protein